MRRHSECPSPRHPLALSPPHLFAVPHHRRTRGRVPTTFCFFYRYLSSRPHTPCDGNHDQCGRVPCCYLHPGRGLSGCLSYTAPRDCNTATATNSHCGREPAPSRLFAHSSWWCVVHRHTCSFAYRHRHTHAHTHDRLCRRAPRSSGPGARFRLCQNWVPHWHWRQHERPGNLDATAG